MPCVGLEIRNQFVGILDKEATPENVKTFIMDFLHKKLINKYEEVTEENKEFEKKMKGLEDINSLGNIYMEHLLKNTAPFGKNIFLFLFDSRKNKFSKEDYDKIGYVNQLLRVRLKSKSLLLFKHDLSDEAELKILRRKKGIFFLENTEEKGVLRKMTKFGQKLEGNFVKGVVQFFIENSENKIYMEENFKISEEDKQYGIDKEFLKSLGVFEGKFEGEEISESDSGDEKFENKKDEGKVDL